MQHRTDAERYADLDAHRTRTNLRPDDGSAYDFARAHADQLVDGNVVPDLDAVADRLADAGPFGHLDPVAEFRAVIQRDVNALADAHGIPRAVVNRSDYPRLGIFID